jgi:hypothetical protein
MTETEIRTKAAALAERADLTTLQVMASRLSPAVAPVELAVVRLALAIVETETGLSLYRDLMGEPE